MSKRKWYTGPKELTKHHILPSSRSGEDNENNIAMVQCKHHEIYHTLFSNKTPVEIITYLVEYFFAGQWGYVEQALEKSHDNIERTPDG